MESLFNRAARRGRNGQSGFTLIELLVVIGILAILAAVVIFNIIGVTNKGKNAAACTDVKTIQSAADAYYNDHSQTYPAIDGLTGDGSGGGASPGWGDIVPNYIHQQPPAADGKYNLSAATGRVTAANATGC